jgi:type II secretory pathway component PulF
MADLHFSYVAIDRTGRRVRGQLSAGNDAAAYDQLKRDGFSPINIKARQATKVRPAKTQRLGNREIADFLSGLAELLKAGADIRTALGILSARFERASVKKIAEDLASDIGGGEPLDRAFGRAFQKSEAFVAPMVAAGEAAGDLPGGLQRAADVIYSRLKLRDQLVTVLAYPSFVFVSAIGALVVILLYIVPSIAPLAEELGSEPPMALSLMLSASNFLSANLALIGLATAGAAAATLGAARAGLLSAPLDRLLLDGPVRRTVSGLVFGSFSMSLGSMVAAGAPISEALRLAIRTAPLAGARKRLEPVALAVRQGEYVSGALGEVRGFPQSIIRLAAVGEASNAVGPMLTRSGQMEEDAALRRIETIGRIAGPALIVLLGGLLGVLMGGLLSGVSQMGQSALE